MIIIVTYPFDPKMFDPPPGFQRSDGAYGALTIRQPRELDAHGKLYDTDLSEHQILLTDWIKEMAVERWVNH